MEIVQFNQPQTDALRLLVNYIVISIVLFLTITENFNGEIQTLAYPKAALFSLSMALVAYNLSPYVLRWSACMELAKAGLSDFYLVDEIQGIYRHDDL